VTHPANAELSSQSKPARATVPPKRLQQVGLALLVIASFYFCGSYLLAPLIWRVLESRHPSLAGMDTLTVTGDKHPGDPINIAIIATDEALRTRMAAAGWKVADPLGLRSDIGIAVDSVTGREYDKAPVSNLYYWGRKEDVAFERPEGKSPRQRHHVRFWKSAELDEQGRPLWAGAATFDKSIGVSHTTGQITHHIDGDVDSERNSLIATLQKDGQSLAVDWIENFHTVRTGNNGGGDKWRTDGRLPVVEFENARPSF
jgi:hypothetical protein